MTPDQEALMLRFIESMAESLAVISKKLDSMDASISDLNETVKKIYQIMP